jgi:hypothetical protein
MVEKSRCAVVGVDDVPDFGNSLTGKLVLPSGQSPTAVSIEELTLSIKPNSSELLPIVNTLSSMDVATLLQRLSSDEIQMLRSLGSNVLTHDLSFVDEPEFIEKMAKSFYQIQSASILTINNIGPVRWADVIGNLDPFKRGRYDALTESEKDHLRSNVYSVARSFATLTDEALATLDALRGLRGDAPLATEPASFLRDHVIKRAVDCNHHAWRYRKWLEGQPHNDANLKVGQLDDKMRLFAGLMGLGTFQFLREGGIDVCKGILKLGEAIRTQGEVDVEAFRRSVAETPLVTGIPFKSGESIYASPDLIQHFREAHHNLWLMNRALSWLLPGELHQPQREGHVGIDELSRPVANSSSVQILALATSFAAGQSDPAFQQVVKDLLGTAAKGNPFDLDPGVFNSKGERI